MITLLLIVGITVACAQHDPNWVKGRSGIVHLFEWKWRDIAKECAFLKAKGYAAVQVSPVQENVILPGRPWYERYQTVSYKIETRSGNEEDFLVMTTACNKAGIRIYPDLIINHMTALDASHTKGTAGSIIDTTQKSYPTVPYTNEHFHPTCAITTYMDPWIVRECELVSLQDLDQSQDYVREKILELLNKLIDLGVGGFRVDAAKHIWPEDLKYIYDNTKDLNTDFGFESHSRPFIYQEVPDFRSEPIKREEYTPLGRVTEFLYGNALNRLFNERTMKLSQVNNWGSSWNFMTNGSALVFVNNHDTQRNPTMLNYRKKKQYVMANAFMLAQPFGIPRVMSSFDFQKSDDGPPMDDNETIKSPEFGQGECRNGWICEHRWPQIANMIGFSNVVEGTTVDYFSWETDEQIAFCRGDKGFIAFNLQGEMSARMKTCLPLGVFCDIISGGLKEDGTCAGKVVHVGCNGFANIYIPADDPNGVIAIHIDSLRK